MLTASKLDAISTGKRSFEVGDEVFCTPEGVPGWRRIVRITPDGRHHRLHLKSSLFEKHRSFPDWLMLSLLLIGQAEIR